MEGLFVLSGAVLWRMGGAGWPPLGKDWRRIGVPLLTLVGCLSQGFSVLQAILSAVVLAVVVRFPVTFIGSSVPGHWFNWVWLFLAGYLLGIASAVTHGWSGLLLALIPAMAQGVSISLSNIPVTANDWPHEACEILIGASVIQAIL